MCSDVPKLLYLSDWELHCYNDDRIFQDFDAAIVSCSQVGIEVERSHGIPTFTAPAFGGLSAIHQGLLNDGEVNWRLPDERDTDILFTGSIGTPLYIEKPSHFYQLSQLPDRFHLEFLDKTFPIPEYLDRLSRAKFTTISLRLPGCINTRALQALRQGTMVLCDERTALDLYLEPESEGLCIYRQAHMEEDVCRFLDSYGALAAAFFEGRPRLMEKLAKLAPPSPAAENNWLKLAYAFSKKLAPRAAKRGGYPRNQAINWFSARAYAKGDFPANFLCPNRRGEDFAVKDLASRLTWAVQRNEPDVVEELAKRPFSSPAKDRFALPFNLLLVAAMWHSKSWGAYFQGMGQIWAERDTYRASPLDGLPFHDIRLGLFWRKTFIDEQWITDFLLRPNSPQGIESHHLLLNGVSTSLALRSRDEGDFERTQSFLAEAAKHYAGNPVTRHYQALLEIEENARVRAWDRLQDCLSHWYDAVSIYPWFIPEIFPLVIEHRELDALIFEGELAQVYAKFFQRVRSDRAHLSALELPEKAQAYLSWKLGLSDHCEPLLELERFLSHWTSCLPLLMPKEDARKFLYEPIKRFTDANANYEQRRA